MTRRLLQLAPLCLLAACADPLSGLEKLSDVELAETDPVRGAVASSDEITRDAPVLTNLLTPSADSDAGQGVDLVPEGDTVPQKRSLFARLIAPKPSNDTVNPVIDDIDPLQISTEDAADISANDANSVATNVGAESLEDTSLDGDVQVASVASGTQKNRVGLFGLLRRPAALPNDGVVDAPTKTDETDEIGDVQSAAAVPPDDTLSDNPEVSKSSETSERQPERRGFLSNVGFGARADKPRKGPDAEDVVPGTSLAYGTVARVCDIRGKDLGKRIERAGSGKTYALYDTAPNSTAPRTFYVTGFSDGCARQFTAALALFGAPSMHEQLRYGRPADQYPYSTTDKAYELVKSAICGVSKRKPCGSKISRLEKDTVFISTYERFTDNGRWADILLHDGRVLAKAIKDL